MLVLSACKSVHQVLVPGAQGGQKRASDPLELKLQRVISCCVDAGNLPRSSGEQPVLVINC